MTLLIASAFVDTVAELEQAVLRARQAGADALEARLDCFREPASSLRDFLRRQGDSALLLTCRSRSEGGRFAGTPVEAGLHTVEIAEGTTAWIDIEWTAWRTGGELRQKALSHAASHPFTKVILSAHFPGAAPERLQALVQQALYASPQIVAKVAYHAEHITQSFAALDLMRQFGPRIIAIAMGEPGAWTRLLARKLGAFATFASLDCANATAPGQYTVTHLRQEFGWYRVNADTRVFGVVGDPVAHSLSPKLFNRWFEQHRQNAVFAPLHLGADEAGLEQFLAECLRRLWLNVGGLSVTIPHKVAALQWAGENADPLSRAIGAANTLVLGNSAQAAYNTDCYAAIESLAAALGRKRSELAGLAVDVLGAGGAARAVVYGLCEMGCRVSVFARSKSKATDFAEWGATVRDWEERRNEGGEVLVNCTPIGMWSAVSESPMPADVLRGRRLVFDLIYRPLRTKLLIDAQPAGCQTLGGLDMFVRQAATQFALWTGISADIPAASSFLQELLESDTTKRSSVALIGARGSGKTVVGKLLADLLGLPHLDTDEMVVADAGQSITQIFAAEGETGFRLRESHAVQRAVESPPAVISLGGGAILDPRNVAAIRGIAKIVWLTACPSDLVNRVAGDSRSESQRPSLLTKPPFQEMEETLRVRESTYRATADLIIDTTNVRIDEVASMIAAWLKNHS